jgi:hypothetical protein
MKEIGERFALNGAHVAMLISFLLRQPPLFGQQLVEQFRAHVHAYAEILHRWKMDHQRLELLKAVGKSMSLKKEAEGHGISKSLIRSASRCD